VRQRGHLGGAPWLLNARARLHVKVTEVAANHRDRKCNDYNAADRAHGSDDPSHLGHGNYVTIPQSSDCHDRPPEGFWDAWEHFCVGFVLCEVNHTGK